MQSLYVTTTGLMLMFEYLAKLFSGFLLSIIVIRPAKVHAGLGGHRAQQNFEIVLIAFC